MKTLLLFSIQILFISTSFSEVKAIYNYDKVEISWSNPAHINVDYFVIERSKNGKTFKEVLKVDGAKNNGSSIEYYEIDNKPLRKKAYYRIREVALNGQIYYSEMVAATNINYVQPLIGLFVNPLNNNKLKNYDQRDILVVLIDNMGEEYIAKINLVEENKNLVVNTSNINLPTGEYLISATSDDKIYGKKIIVKGNNATPVYTQNR